MSARSYMSIGDVLTLLRQEFPDVTISKIRFLESQGLVNPERTPSGYRKFYQHDVERLRWVLRQQRENFLPLKVIKDRLDDEGDEAAKGSEDAEAPPGAEPVLVGQRVSAEAAEGVGAQAPRESRERAADPAVGVRSDGTTLPGIEGGTAATNGAAPAHGAGAAAVAASAAVPPRPAESRRPAPAPASAAVAADEPATGRGSHGVDPRATVAEGGSPAVDPVTASARPRSNRAPAAGPAPAAGGGAGPDDQPAPAAGGSRQAPAGGGRSKGSRTTPPAGPGTDAGGPGDAIASMSMEELSAACGLEAAMLEELVGFGLLTGTTVAGQVYFDDEALAVAKAAAGFARFGVEPRHLRLYKNAADREAGFVEQIVIPLVRQRNPEARVRAHETVDELAQLGQELRASLLRTALSSLLDG